jgi:hypothetical protein
VYQRERDWPAMRAACHARAVAMRDAVTALTRPAPIAPATTELRDQLCAVSLPQDARMPAEL